MEEYQTSKKGSVVYENWKDQLSGKELYQTLTYELFSDADFSLPRENFGPYRIKKTNETYQDYHIYHLEIDQFLLFKFNAENVASDDSRWHSGTGKDELAALLALQLGRKLKAGNFYTFKPAGKGVISPDHLIRPFGSYEMNLPILPKTYKHRLPNTLIKNNKSFELLDLLPQIDVDASVALVKAARNYQEAIWIADIYPEISWILLTSAIETAANFWRNNQFYDNKELLKESNPELYSEFQNQAEVLDTLSEQLAHLFRLRKKFQDFLILFKPDPPKMRPSKPHQVKYSDSQLKKAFYKIYEYRSRALHNGISFPEPMCSAPHLDKNGYYEKPIEDGWMTGFGFATWDSSDTPMNLNTFEYIARNALQNWWQSLVKT